MIKYILPTLIMESLMVVFTVFVFDNLGKKINEMIKKYFLEKLQDYNYMIDEKEAELEKLRKEVEKNKELLAQMDQMPKVEFSNQIEKNLKQMRSFKKGQNKVRENAIISMPNPEYRDKDFFSNYKKLKTDFRVNVENTIKEFIKKNQESTSDLKTFEVIKDLRNKLNEDVIYESLVLTNIEQYNIFESGLTEKEKKLLDFSNTYPEKRKFSVLNLKKQVDTLYKQYDPSIYIYVPIGTTNDYTTLDSNIVQEEYKNISEGVIIKYKGKIYDYSI
jgi:hypothetical protein